MPKSRLLSARRIVVKVGSNVLTAAQGLNLEAVESLSTQISRLIDKGLEVLFVSSGAMAAGMRKMGLSRRPDEIPKRQAMAAVGQSGLMNAYETAFGRHGKKVAQILLTAEDLNNRRRYLNARNTLHTLLEWQVVPIINENDTVMVEEIKLGDNDNLAAMITLLMDADFLINLTDIDGLYTQDPRTRPDAHLIPMVSVFKREIETYASHIPGALGRGGMLSKIKAAKKVNGAGVPMIIANGTTPGMLLKLFSGEPHGTYFEPGSKKMNRRKCWIAYTLTPKGTLIVDDGAEKALRHGGKSLLSIGIREVRGAFREGAAVAIENQAGAAIGVGLVNYNAADIRAIMGMQSHRISEILGAKPYDEVVHRDNLVITPHL
ncbi:MAG: glutamate 5-kinase [Desulfatitalea sp.]|nr:glutamate 5-kinase [Desulfatitalea sp.]NNJ99899.1 glutamate 5-kinase [Desulfatitalea sp.]